MNKGHRQSPSSFADLKRFNHMHTAYKRVQNNPNIKTSGELSGT